jgi:aminotransferase
LGAAEAVLDVSLAFLNPGDEVLYPEPSRLNYSTAARLLGATLVPVPLHAANAFQIDLDEVRRLITTRTRMMILVSPHNPSGTLQSPETVRRLASLATDRNLLDVSNEICERIIYDDLVHVSSASSPGMREGTIALNEFSKAFSVTGWRLGYAAAPRHLIQTMNRVHQYNVACACSFAQEGAVAALRGPQDCVTAVVAEFKRRRDMPVLALNTIEGVSVALTRAHSMSGWTSGDWGSHRRTSRCDSSSVPMCPLSRGPFSARPGRGACASPTPTPTIG